MNHLLRPLAPISDEAWEQIENEARRALRTFLAARRLVDFSGPHGWEHSALGLGRVDPVARGPAAEVESRLRRVQPLVELRTPFRVARSELDAADRGAPDADWDVVIEAARQAALAEDRLVFQGFPSAAVKGLVATSPHPPITISEDYHRYPNHVAQAIETLRRAGVGGPYAIALGPRCYTGRDRVHRARRVPGARAPAPDHGGSGGVGAGRRRGRGAEPAGRRLRARRGPGPVDRLHRPRRASR